MNRSTPTAAQDARGGVAAGQAAQEPTTQRASPQSASQELQGRAQRVLAQGIKTLSPQLKPLKSPSATAFLCYNHGVNKAPSRCVNNRGHDTRRRRSDVSNTVHPLRGKAHPRYKHGVSHLPEYQAWRNMLKRCYNPNDISYHRYGGRGISVCDRWRVSVLDFIADMGRRPSPEHSIDRIDNDGNYEPGNCRWATRKEQLVNFSRNRHVGDQILQDAAEDAGLERRTLSARLDLGWSVEDALTRPNRIGRKALTAKQALTIRHAAHAGESEKALAQRYEVSEASVRDITAGRTFKKAGGPIRPRKTPRVLTDDEVKHIREKAHNGWLMREIAAEFAIPVGTVGAVIVGTTYQNAPGPIRGKDYPFKAHRGS